MKATDFLSNRMYVMLPTKSNPKVYLPIGDFNIVKKAFKLYNPFSKKAKLLKHFSLFLCLYVGPLARIVLPTIQGKKSGLLMGLENKLTKKIVSSVYVATAKDKLVLQLQDQSGVIGYLKYPISEKGEKRLQIEQQAISILSKQNLIPPLLFQYDYEGTPFIILQNLEGVIGEVSSAKYKVVLEYLKKKRTFKLKDHPRVIAIREKLKTLGFNEFENSFEVTVNSSTKKYNEVYEHGDFAAWNLIQTKNGLIPFDFEYFEENGLEHLDEIKFHFQELHLLQQKSGFELINAIENKLKIGEFDAFFEIYLLKELVNKAQEKEPYNLEIELLALLKQK